MCLDQRCEKAMERRIAHPVNLSVLVPACAPRMQYILKSCPKALDDGWRYGWCYQLEFI